jgi:hypothetical protein
VPLEVKHLEIHVAHACNLRCESCSHYSDQGHKGVIALEEADAWMGAWSKRLRPHIFSLVGGEPTIHPRLTEFFRLSRRHWPDAHLRIVTNGFFLHNHPELPKAMQGDAKAHLYLSVHHRSPEYIDALRPNAEILQGWVRDYGIQVSRYDSVDYWRRTHHGSGASMLPYEDANPRASWEPCQAKTCPQLFEGRLWKCAPLAYLGMQHAKYGLSEKWKPYLAYPALAPDCDDEALAGFFRREEESYCGMCPSKPEKFALPMPMVVRRK